MQRRDDEASPVVVVVGDEDAFGLARAAVLGDERLAEGLDAGVALLGILRERLEDHGVVPARQARADLARRNRVLKHVLGEHAHVGLAVEGRASHEQLVGDTAERVDVASVGELGGLVLAERGLGRHVRRAAHDEVAAGGAVEHAGHAEIADRDAEGPVDEEVGGLQIAVDGAGRVDGLDPEARLIEDTNRLVEIGEGAPGPRAEPLIDGAALDVLHDEVGRPLVLAEREDRQHVAMPDARHGPRLVVEERAHLREREELRLDELDGDLAIEPLVDGQRHGSHAADAERALDAVLVVDEGPDVEADRSQRVDRRPRARAGSARGTTEAAS